MTKFDFKQWVIKNKHGKLNEQDARRRPRRGREMDAEMPPENVELPNPDDIQMDPSGPASMVPQTNPCDTGIFGNIGCETWEECGSGDTRALHFAGGAASYTNTAFVAWSGASVNDYKKFTNTVTGNSEIWQYKGVIAGTFTEDLGDSGDWSVSDCCDCTCIYGCTDSAFVEYDPNATCDDGSCVTPIPATFTECQNCCCRSNIQAKVLGPQDPIWGPDDGGELGENLNPTIDKISKLIKLAEQRSGKQARMSDEEAFFDDFLLNDPDNPSGDYADPTDKPQWIQPKSPTVPSTTGPGGPPSPSGPCGSGHYIASGTPGVWNLGNTFQPSATNMIDAATGFCSCENNDPNNTGGLSGTLYAGIQNPSPGTPNTTGAPNGTGPCP